MGGGLNKEGAHLKFLLREEGLIRQVALIDRADLLQRGLNRGG